MARVPVNAITLDARGWREFRDIYAALLPALGAPDWHGPNLDAVYDALVAGHYRVALPLVVTIRDTASASEAVRAYLPRLVTVFDDARAQYGIDARLVIA
ncbi:barstar family protein [Sphingomonas sp. RHCKR47]|nr:barstar family protein [Sphingomonas citricola]